MNESTVVLLISLLVLMEVSVSAFRTSELDTKWAEVVALLVVEFTLLQSSDL